MELLKSTLKLLQLIRYIIVHSCITLTALISWTKTNVIAEALVQGTYEVKRQQASPSQIQSNQRILVHQRQVIIQTSIPPTLE